MCQSSTHEQTQPSVSSKVNLPCQRAYFIEVCLHTLYSLRQKLCLGKNCLQMVKPDDGKTHLACSWRFVCFCRTVILPEYLEPLSQASNISKVGMIRCGIQENPNPMSLLPLGFLAVEYIHCIALNYTTLHCIASHSMVLHT